jgi:hypothetical protein
LELAVDGSGGKTRAFDDPSPLESVRPATASREDVQALRPDPPAPSSLLQEGTAAGAAALALMSPAGGLPERPVELKRHAPAPLAALPGYRAAWRAMARQAAP